MSEPLLPGTFLFRFTIPCRYHASDVPVQLAPRFEMPCFAMLDGGSKFARVSMAWNENGLLFDVEVTGKKKTLWCRGSRPEDSDGLRLWIDTRDTKDIHRAGRFCHQFILLPDSDGRRSAEPVGRLADIHLARENPRRPSPASIRLQSEIRPDGYRLWGRLASAALTGYDPTQQLRLGFFYAVLDRELGMQTLSIGGELPFANDPSLWGTLELVR